MEMSLMFGANRQTYENCYRRWGLVRNAYVDNLISTVIQASEADTWEAAVLEWEITDCVEDPSCTSTCICGKESLKYRYTITNKKTHRLLVPIGSSCIHKFERDDLDSQTSLAEQTFRLLHAVERNKYLEFSSELFSRKLLLQLYNDHAFDTAYNNYHGLKDYEFMLKMFNKRDKSSITAAQHKKIKAILLNSIKPHLQKRLQDKIISIE